MDRLNADNYPCIKCDTNVNPYHNSIRLPCNRYFLCDACKQIFYKAESNRIDCKCEGRHNRQSLIKRDTFTVRQ